MTKLSPLFNLGKSELRRKLLLVFFTNMDNRYYLREMAKMLEVDSTNLSRELKRLEDEGLFQSEFSGHQKYFFLNKTFPLFNELKSTINKTIGVPSILNSFFSNIPGIKRAFIYGSFAKGTDKQNSDIDVCLIVKMNQFNLDTMLSGISRLEKEVGREISYIFRTEKEWKSQLKKKDSFILGLEKGKKIELLDNAQN